MRTSWKLHFTAERCAVYAFAIGAVMFAASAIEDFVCLHDRSNGRSCGVLPAGLFYVGVSLALVLLAISVVLWLMTARSGRGKSADG